MPQIIEVTIRPDGKVDIHPVEGFKGNECHKETQELEQALGKVEGTMPVEGAYRGDVVRVDTHQKRG